MFIIKSEVTVSTTVTTPPVTMVWCGAMLIIMTGMLAPISVGQATSGQHDVILLPHLIPRDTVRVFF